MQAIVNATGIAAMVAVGALAAWYRQKGRLTHAVLPDLPNSGNAGVI